MSKHRCAHLFIQANARAGIGLFQALSQKMRKLWPLAALLALISQPALATVTLCDFSVGPYYVEFYGHEDQGPVIDFMTVESDSPKRIMLRSPNYTLGYFSLSERSVNLEFRNPGNPELPPSFSLVGTNGRATLKIGSKLIDGDLDCGPRMPEM
jgi:hypothetical protein